MRPRTVAIALTFALTISLAFSGPALVAAASTKARDGTQPGKLQEPPAYGVYYDRYEPTFYTGFAPRALAPDQVHLHLGRGNQLRVTAVLTDGVLEAYARDLLHRHHTYRRLIDEKEIVLTQNDAFAAFEQTIAENRLEELVRQEEDLSRAERQQRNLELIEKLNPGRVFRIRLPVRELVRRWAAEIRPEDRQGPSGDRQIDLVNALLATRLWVTDVAPGTAKRLRELIAAVPASDALADPEALARLEPSYLALLEEVGHGLYPRRGDAVEFAEFTAIYPVGSLNAFTDYRGRQIPLYPTPGRRALTTHQRTKTVDHIPDVVVYSYSPWIPYMHVGPRMHNAFHTLYWRMEVARAPFLTDEWRENERARHEGGDYRYLWLLSRGPMSHGCTHVNTGHIAELRQVLPAETEALYEVDAYMNRTYDYDVFDIDGDFTPEVMGVRYFIAYSLNGDSTPARLRVANERGAYYDWLYGGDLRIEADGRGVFDRIHEGRFVDRRAEEGRAYERIALYEAAYEPEEVQFYQLVDIPFARELRQVAVDFPYPKQNRLAAR
jgi:hypothetical protein